MDIVIRSVRESDVAEADRIFRTAFGTFLGLPDPLAFAGDSDYVRTRWRLDPTAAFAAEVDGALAGSNFATCWGSVGFFGPLTVRVDQWNAGIARRLLERTMERFEEWGVRHAGLFTFPQSTKHIHLYRSFGFAPRFLTAVMAKPVTTSIVSTAEWTVFSTVPVDARAATLGHVRDLTDAVYGGLDLTAEITGVHEHELGDTVLLHHGGRLAGVAVCHVGKGTEAGSGTCYAKFAAVRPDGNAAARFGDLLDALEAFAATRDARRISAGMNTARRAAWSALQARGFRSEIIGVAMHRPDEPAYSHADAWALDDWR